MAYMYVDVIHFNVAIFPFSLFCISGSRLTLSCHLIAPFFQADSEWRELMREAHTITNTIETCNRDGRLETLERLSSSLERCQRALTGLFPNPMSISMQE